MSAVDVARSVRDQLRTCYYFFSKDRFAEFARYFRLRMQGYRGANPYWRNYGRQSPAIIRRTMDEIAARTEDKTFGVVLELGCGNRYRTTPGLEYHASEVIGIDIIPEQQTKPSRHRYIRVDPDRFDCLHMLPDGSVDTVIILNYTGMHPHSTWQMYFADTNDRMRAYMAAPNFPRVMHSGSYLICIEWESEPEGRWGNASIDQIQQHAAERYGSPAINGYDLIYSGFSRNSMCPFIVYRRR